MLKVDLHVHSRYSSNPADALLKKFGTQESYTEVDEVYQAAKERGMGLVTITDHNTIGGALKLVEKYPREAFLGVELTTMFPEDGCAVHLLVFGFTPAQFAEMDALRYDIYQLRDYIKAAGLPYSVAHPSYSVNGKLTLAAIEKLLLLFDVFETVNGARVAAYNDLFKKVLAGLTPERIEGLRKKHLIAPMSDTPWRKGFTGGSDEHAGLFIGETFTLAEAVDKEGFLACLAHKSTDSGGRSNHYKTQVYTFLKIIHQYSRSRADWARHAPDNALRTQIRRSGGSAVKRAWDELCGAIFDGKSLGWKTQLKIEQLKRSRKGNARLIASQVSSLVRKLVHNPHMPHQERIDLIYETVAGIEDEFFISNFEAFREGFAKGDILKLMSSITAVFRSFLLSLPFLGTFRHLHQSSAIMDELRAAFLGVVPAQDKKILWFTDTLDDLNGVSVTLKGFSEEAAARGLWLKLVTVQVPGARPVPARVDLPMVYEYTPDFYPSYKMRFPSLLKSLEKIYDEAPTEIVVSTPGPVGMVGILAARLFGIPCRGIYHSDFTRMTELGLSGGTVASVVQGYVRWFYSRMDVVFAPTQETVKMLSGRGYDVLSLQVFRRGIDHSVYTPVAGDRAALRACYNLDARFTLLYAGRVSADKSLRFLARVYRELVARGEEINLVIAGEGPLLAELKETLSGLPRVRFTGRVEPRDMPLVYSVSDLLVFPSTMDTFGMSVLEAQACELPALVTNVGGPQEVIEPGVTGWVAAADNAGAWAEGILQVKRLYDNDRTALQTIKSAARQRAQKLFSWEAALGALYGYE
ncbi:MAG: glycosyltransferase [Candidatus Omnitrophica bacterium]|nr:glycosyltransferase [Candidatus Omnitrophota bacterium]